MVRRQEEFNILLKPQHIVVLDSQLYIPGTGQSGSRTDND